MLPASEYGLYGVCFSLTLLCLGVGNAVFLLPFTVRLASSKEAQIHEAATITVCVWLGAGGLLFGALCFCGLLGVLGLGRAAAHFYLVALVLFAGASSICRELYVRLCFIRRQESQAVVIAGVAAATTLITAISCWQLRVPFEAKTAILIYGVGQLLGSLAGAYKADCIPAIFTTSHRSRRLRDYLAESGWPLTGMSVTWIQQQSYLLISATLLGAASAATIGAYRLLIAPLQLMLPALTQVTMPRLVQMNSVNPKNAERFCLKMMAVGVLGASLYGLALLSLAQWLVPVAFAGKYPVNETLVLAWCLAVVAQISRDSSATLLQVRGDYRALAKSNGFSALIGLCFAFVLSNLYGASGAVCALAIGELALSGLIQFRIHGKSTKC